MSYKKIKNKIGVLIDEFLFINTFSEYLKRKISPYIDFTGGAATIIVDSTIKNSLSIEDELGNVILRIDAQNQRATIFPNVFDTDDTKLIADRAYVDLKGIDYNDF